MGEADRHKQRLKAPIDDVLLTGPPCRAANVRTLSCYSAPAHGFSSSWCFLCALRITLQRSLGGSLLVGHAQRIEGYTLWIGKLVAQISP